MKNKILSFHAVLFMCLLLVCPCITANEEEPLPEGLDAPFGLSPGSYLPDADFDVADLTWKVSTSGSNVGKATYSWAEDDHSQKGGSFLVSVEHDGGKTNALQITNDTVNGVFIKGKPYVVSFWAKLENTPEYKINQIWLRSTAENVCLSNKRAECTLVEDGKWHYYAVVLNMAENADAVRLMMQFGNQNKTNFRIYFDEIKLRAALSEEPLRLPGLEPVNTVKFNDISGHWAEKEITDMAEKGIINGKDETTFEPDLPVTRAEFVAMLVRAVGFRDTDEENPFADTSRDDWFSRELNIATAMDIIDPGMIWKGYFYPDAELCREELAMFLANSHDKMTGRVTQDIDITYITDRKQISRWAIIYVQKSIKLGLMNGVTYYDVFEPRGTVTRAQAAVAIARLRQEIEQKLI